MRLMLRIDGLDHQIDSTDPDLLARWIVEMFGRIRQITPDTLIELQTWPSFVWDDDAHGWAPDWIADSRVIGQVMNPRTPRELVDALNKQLDQWEAFRGDDH